VVKYRFEADLIDRLLRSEWWLYDLPRHLERQSDLPLSDPERMLDFLAEHGSRIERIDPTRKRYLRKGNKISVQDLRLAGT